MDHDDKDDDDRVPFIYQSIMVFSSVTIIAIIIIIDTMGSSLSDHESETVPSLPAVSCKSVVSATRCLLRCSSK